MWNHFCNHAESRLAEAGAIIAVSLRDARLIWNDFEIRKSRAHANLLRVALEMSHNDWPDLAAFMRDCIEGLSAERLTSTERVAIDSGFWSSDRMDLVPDNNAFHLSVRNRECLEVATISRRHFIHSCDSFFWLVDVPGYIPQSDRAMRAKTLDDALRYVMEILREECMARRERHSATAGADEKPVS